MQDIEIQDISEFKNRENKKEYFYKVNTLGKGFIASRIDDLCKLDVDLRVFRGDKKILFCNYIFKFL